MGWINRKDKEPDNNQLIIVFCKRCRTCHTVMGDGIDWYIPEACNEAGVYFAGEDVDFDYWMEQPGKPDGMD